MGGRTGTVSGLTVISPWEQPCEEVSIQLIMVLVVAEGSLLLQVLHQREQSGT